MQASPVLDALAAKQIEDGTPLAADAVMYLGRFGGAAMKPVVWEQLSRWHRRYTESGAKERMEAPPGKPDDWQLYDVDSRLRGAYISAQGWTLSPEDVLNLKKLLGDKETAGLESVGPAAGKYYIYGNVNDPVYPVDARIDYLMPMQPFQYSVNQYRCADLNALEQKLLQFPQGSTFYVAHTGFLGDGKGDWPDISAFLINHGYLFRNSQ